MTGHVERSNHGIIIRYDNLNPKGVDLIVKRLMSAVNLIQTDRTIERR